MRAALAKLLAEHTWLRVLSGGQRGVDLWAAEAARSAGLAFELLLPAPVEAFAADWSRADARRLRSLERAAAEVVLFGGPPNEAAYRRRNLALAERCDLLVAVWTGRRGGGTTETIALARARGRPIREVLLPPSDYSPAPGERGI